eukprot:Clim_evm76s77 gene=Clim_evmTU76s77
MNRFRLASRASTSLVRAVASQQLVKRTAAVPFARVHLPTLCLGQRYLSGESYTMMIDAFKKEIEYEAKNQEDVNPEAIPDSWTLDSKEGERAFSVIKQDGDHEIKVTLDVTSLGEDEEEDPEAADEDEIGGADVMPFLVEVKKNGVNGVVEFTCEAFKGDFQILHMGYAPDSEAKDADVIYTGPEFYDLDTKLQESVYQFLVNHGIDDQLLAVLSDHAALKEQKEYVTWLKNCQTFLS